jgi:hypothetical protein
MSDLVKVVNPLEWKTMVHYHYGNDKDKKELIKNLKLCWEQADKNQEKTQRTYVAYDAMEALFSEFRESSMRIIIFSTRNRKVKRDGKEIGLDQFVDDSNLLGLKKCINEWNSQADSRPKKDVETIKMMRQDSLTELIISHEELRNKGEYMIAAIIQRVRRLRKATDHDLSKLSFGDSLLQQADKIRERQEDEIVERENFMVVPNKMINVAIDMQKLLNENRKATTSGAKRINELDKQLDDYQKEVVKGTAQHTWYQIYKWWLLRIKLRQAQKRLDVVEAKKIDKYMETLEDKMKQHSSYLHSLKSSPRKKGKKDKKDPYDRLQEHHNQLANFMHNPTWKDNSLAAKERKKVKWSKKSVDQDMLRNLEYAAFPGGTRLRRWKIHPFLETANLSPIELVSKNGKIKKDEYYSKDWKENRRTSSLIQKCRVSISNSSLMTQNIIVNNSHIAPATLILNAVDLMVRIRWLLATPKVHNMKKLRSTKNHPWVRVEPTPYNVRTRQSFREKNEERISTEIKDGLVFALSEIEQELKIYGAERAHEAVKTWVKSLKNLPLETRKSGVGPLGQLCDHCGTLLGWKWENPEEDRGRESDLYSEWDRIEIERKKLKGSERVQVAQNEWEESPERIHKGKEEEHAALLASRKKIEESIKKMKTCLLLKDSDGKELLRIDTADESRNPYLKPFGETSSYS